MSEALAEERGEWVGSRAGVIVAMILGTVGTMIFLAGGNWVGALAVVLSDGMLALGWVVSAGMAGGYVLRRLGVEANRSLWLATSAGVGLGIFSLVILGLGLMGWLNAWSVYALAGGGLAIGLIEIWVVHGLNAPVGERLERWLRQPAGASWLWALVGIPLGFAFVGASIFPAILWKPDDPHPYDVLIYHLQVPREWWEMKRIVALQHNVYSYFPFNVEMHFLAGMHLKGGPWKGMYFCQFVNVWMAGVFVLAMRGCAGRVAGVISALVPWVILVSCVCYVEAGLMMFSALAVAWGLKWKDNWRAMVVGGMCCGFASGVKFTAIPMIGLGLGLGLIVMERNWVVVKRVLLYGIVAVACVSPWMIRNAVWTGNPVFPLAMQTLGRGHFTEGQVARFEKAHRAPERDASVGGRLARDWSEVIWSWKYGWIVLAGAVAIGLSRGWSREVGALLIVIVVMQGIWLGATHLISRFFVVGIPVGLMMIAPRKTPSREGREGKTLEYGTGEEPWWQRWVERGLVGMIIAGCLLGIGTKLVPMMNQYMTWVDNGLAFGFEDPKAMEIPALETWRATGEPLYKVGDSQAYMHNSPMVLIKYRTPFDVDNSAGDALQAWLGKGVDRNRVWMLVDQPELERLNKTYGTPVPALGYESRTPFLVAPGGAIIQSPN